MKKHIIMKNFLILRSEDYDMNLYLKIGKNGEIKTFNYSFGVEDVDIDFTKWHDEKTTNFVAGFLAGKGYNHGVEVVEPLLSEIAYTLANAVCVFRCLESQDSM